VFIEDSYIQIDNLFFFVTFLQKYRFRVSLLEIFVDHRLLTSTFFTVYITTPFRNAKLAKQNFGSFIFEPLNSWHLNYFEK